MTDPTFLAEFPWVSSSPVGLKELRRWSLRDFPSDIAELALPKYQLYLSMFLEWLPYNYADAAGNYRKTFEAKVTGEVPAGWTDETLQTWTVALEAIYPDFTADLSKLKAISAEKNADKINASLAAGRAAELRIAAEERGIDPWVDAIMAIGSQFAVKERVNDAVNAFDAFEELGWKKAQATIKENVGAAILEYGPAEEAVRDRAAAYKKTGDYPDLEAMTLALVEHAQAAQALGQAIYDTADAGVTWAVGYAKEQHIKNLANTNPELSEGLLVVSTSVYVISGALSAAGIAFPPAAVAGGVVSALATGVKWLVTKIDAEQAVKNRDHVKKMLTVQFGSADGDPTEIIKSLKDVAGIPEKVKAGLEVVEKVAEKTGDILRSARAEQFASGVKVVTDAMATPLLVVSPLVEATDLALEFLEADAKEERPRFDPATTARLLKAIDTAYSAIDPSTKQVNRAESKLLGAVGQGQWSVLLVGADGRAMGGIVDEATMTFQPDREYTLQAFAKQTVRGGHDRTEWEDAELEGTITAYVDLAPDKCGIGEYDAQHAALRVTAPVNYAAKVKSHVASWTENKTIDVYADGELGIDWKYTQQPYIPWRVYYPNLLDEDFALSSEHPYRGYAQITFDDNTPRHLEKRSGVTVPEQESKDFDAWWDKVQATIREEDERLAKITEQYIDERERFS
jgi:hypothetical protein